MHFQIEGGPAPPLIFSRRSELISFATGTQEGYQEVSPVVLLDVHEGVHRLQVLLGLHSSIPRFITVDYFFWLFLSNGYYEV
jgi:hypothetical protein